MATCLLAGVALVVPMAGCGSNAEVASWAPESVRALDIQSGHVEIIGFLGYPIGEFVEIRGIWLPPRSQSYPEMRFQDSMVNERVLDPPVEFDRPLVEEVGALCPAYVKPDGRATRHYYQRKPEAPEPKAGQIWEMRGCETGMYQNLPEVVDSDARALGADGHPGMYRRGFTFVTKFRFSAYQILDHEESPDESRSAR